ncbi:MAG: AAA family ATPase [Chloroflexi bacterium]|jgi:chromosome partitioning protein|nr:AAA family ATPase [Chloroflexota bacterium]
MTASVYTVENRKGGVAKTTTAVTLAYGLSERLLENDGGRVLLVDLDPQGDTARALGLKPEGRCLSYVLTGEGSLRDNIMPADRSADGGPSRPNLFVLPASDNLRSAKETLLSQLTVNMVMAQIRGKGNDNGVVPMVEILNDRLGPAKQVFDYIILDCPPTLDMLQEAVHNFADAAIVPVKADFHSTSAVGRHTRNILDDQAGGITISIKAVVPTFVDKRLRLTRSMLDQLQRTYGNLVTEPVPNTVRVAEAPASGGLTVIEYAPDSPATTAYQHLVDFVYEG